MNQEEYVNPFSKSVNLLNKKIHESELFGMKTQIDTLKKQLLRTDLENIDLAKEYSKLLKELIDAKVEIANLKGENDLLKNANNQYKRVNDHLKNANNKYVKQLRRIKHDPILFMLLNKQF